MSCKIDTSVIYRNKTLMPIISATRPSKAGLRTLKTGNRNLSSYRSHENPQVKIFVTRDVEIEILSSVGVCIGR